jgi:hypothetical protein
MKDTRRCSSQAIGIARWNEWKGFQRGIALVSSWGEAHNFGACGPKTGTPGSSFYTNLLFFVHHDSVPLGADAPQIAIYDALVARLGRPPTSVQESQRRSG